MIRILTGFSALFLCLSLQAQLAIEQWRDHFPNRGTIGVTHGNGRIYCANSNLIYSINLEDNSIEKISKVNLLSDAGISAIAFDPVSSTLVVGYESGNLDLIRNGLSINVNSIQNSGIFGIRSINDIYIDNGRCYLSCGFGIVYFDLINQEVIDTYIIGPGGANLQVYAIAKFNGKIYAATDIGLLSADADHPFLANFVNWSPEENLPNSTEVTDVGTIGSYLLFLQNSGETDVLFATADFEEFISLEEDDNLRGFDISGNHIISRLQNEVKVYQSDLSWKYGVSDVESNEAVIMDPNEIWVGDLDEGLIHYKVSANSREAVQPAGPAHLDAYKLQFIDERLFKSSGSPSSNWSPNYNPHGTEVFSQGEWITYDSGSDPVFHTENIRDLMVVAVDPDDPAHWFIGTWLSGIIEYRNGELVHRYHEENAPLQGAEETGGRAPVGGLAYDNDGNLWISNGYSETPVLALTPEGEWHAFSPNSAGGQGSLLYSDLLIDQSGYKWFVRPRGHGVVVYNHNGTLEDATDDAAVAFTNEVGKGNLPTMDIYSIAEDLNGEIWIGTGEGIAVVYSPGSIFSGGNYDAQQILLEQDGNLQVLLETEQVRSIAVDGANRKWLGTAGSGLFLMSADGTEQIHHFTTSNSPLPSDVIQSIAIDGATGEVFIGTDNGVVSYRSTATDGAISNECAKVFPNPVRENYYGPVAITGLERNTNVKITDVAGNLVFETTSEGGQAIWNAQNFQGNRVTTGVYTALCTAPEGNSKCVAKIMVVR